MSDVVVRVVNLQKIYRLYSKPSKRFLDMFGLLRRPEGAYTEHAALAGVTFNIRRGEKVAIIGRNGAGKSTLLKLVTRVIEPTAGVLEIQGKVQALLQIGSGFHPDFTGRQNVYAYFAQLGVAGKLAAQKCAEVIEFAELEEYIDQPIKTYSTGMAVRLMFATSTAITPDMLILDEVLGVGDAYFAHKSYERIRELCEREKTTLLLVSHDIYTAAKICNRMIWLDHGRLMADLDPAETLRVYEDSVRIQEEQRLRKKATDALVRQRTSTSIDEPTPDSLIIEIAATPPPAAAPTYFSRIALLRDRALVADAPLGDQPPAPEASLITDGSAWSPPLRWNGRDTRSMLHFGSAFHKVGVLFSASGLEASAEAGALSIEMDYSGPAQVDLEVRAFVNGREFSLGRLPFASDEWTSHRVDIGPEAAAKRPAVKAPVGTGAIVIRGARLVDETGTEAFVLRHGGRVHLEIDFEVADPSLVGKAGIGIAILRGGVETACRFFTPDLVFDGRDAPRGTIEMCVRENWLGTGIYTVTVMITRDGYADQPAHPFYSISPDVYACVRDLLEFEVKGGNIFATGTPVLARGEWTMKTAAHTPSE